MINRLIDVFELDYNGYRRSGNVFPGICPAFALISLQLSPSGNPTQDRQLQIREIALMSLEKTPSFL
ncbi:MAG: hypothetical protein D3914_11560 [Candidatus Electrothrix sp. LOE2]|nr:hypothetical protein [Candidatus Electrothrix sp. LOE2]